MSTSINPTPLSPSTGTSAKPKLLMIDDAEPLHGLVEFSLNDDGLEFHSAYGGDHGLAMAAAVRPDVILLDVEMPPPHGPDGFEVCRRLKADPATSAIPVIFLSAATSTEEKVRGLNLGAMDYVGKPFDAAELQARVRASLRTKELLDLLNRKAMIDGLTGLWNRAYFDQRLAAEVSQSRRYGRPLSCVMADVDRFKNLNDTHGHGFGDGVLRGVARAMQERCRTEDVLCRYGGEEFAILTPGTPLEGAALFAERMRAAVAAQPFVRGAVSVAVTCSFGVASMPALPQELVERADRALYQSKHGGRNRVTVAGREEHEAGEAAA